VAEAKAWPGLDTKPPLSDEFADDTTLGYVYGAELEQLLAQAETVMELPAEGWLFKPDLKYVGADEKWYLVETATDDWKPIRIAEFWERQGFGYLDGPGWYRREIAFEDIPERKRLYLSFGAVDESCHVWIDGKYVAAYDRGVPGWDEPFAIEVTGAVTSGKHTLIIRAHDNRRMGGIWKPVSLIAK
jgi:beta-galactosidase/beta-glucuronidase